ncbi:hypothetical protein KJ682_12775 [bacterium]|nr:hypothetical protein [bacterium]
MFGEVKLLIRKLGLFSLPFVLYAVVIAVVDPYDFLPGPSPFGEEIKREISFKLNYAMWEMTRFKEDPAPNILLGDSRMMSMPLDRIEEVSGRGFFNLSYGGGSLREAIDTFHYARQTTRIEHAYFGINLNSYNGSSRKDRVSEVLAAQRNPLIYLVNTNVTLSAGRILWSAITRRPPAIGQPLGDKDAFWKEQLEVTTRVFFSNYQDPVDYRRELGEIAALCRTEGIGLTFIIFPNHKDLQDKILDYGLAEESQTFRDDLAGLATTYDFAFENEMTRNRDNFKDPYHFTANVKELIIQSVWGGRPEFVKILGPESELARSGNP